jgi:hypothetical protein
MGSKVVFHLFVCYHSFGVADWYFVRDRQGGDQACGV